MSAPHAVNVVIETNFPTLKFLKRGKVRDMYETGGYLLIVATDRLSAFDVVMPQGIPYKGKVLTQISEFWFNRTKEIIPNHLVSTNVDDFPEECAPYRDVLRGRTMLVKKSNPLAIECIVRGYLSGSGWNDYKATQSVCGIWLPAGLVDSSRLPEPIFTPSTKADVGVHDQNISFDEAKKILGADVAEKAQSAALAIYRFGCRIAEEHGIIIADTKFEFGLEPDGNLILIDEVLTPDSSRFWPKVTYQPGRAQSSYDKQFVRDFLLSINFNKQPPGPVMPDDVINKTSELYREAIRQLTGKEVE
jgi:phosphoribosylaminoimidazole-succinocarboxamide synthase